MASGGLYSFNTHLWAILQVESYKAHPKDLTSAVLQDLPLLDHPASNPVYGQDPVGQTLWLCSASKIWAVYKFIKN